jgi:hypothetical protein
VLYNKKIKEERCVATAAERKARKKERAKKAARREREKAA